MLETKIETKLPRLVTPLPGPAAKRILQLDSRYISPSYTRSYPLVAKTGRGAMIEDVDGNVFLDFTAGIAVVSTGHCHPEVVAAVQKQAAELIHMSGTDFYYPQMVELAERLSATGESAASARLEVSQDLIAAFANLSRQTTNRQLRRLARAGLAGLERGAVDVRDLAALRGVAAGHRPAPR